jgi:hypothetical protein
MGSIPAALVGRIAAGRLRCGMTRKYHTQITRRLIGGHAEIFGRVGRFDGASRSGSGRNWTRWRANIDAAKSAGRETGAFSIVGDDDVSIRPSC